MFGKKSLYIISHQDISFSDFTLSEVVISRTLRQDGDTSANINQENMMDDPLEMGLNRLEYSTYTSDKISIKSDESAHTCCSNNTPYMVSSMSSVLTHEENFSHAGMLK